MEFDKTVWEFEKNRLEMVLEQVEKQLYKARHATDVRKREVISIQRSMWDYVNPTPGGDLDDFANIWQYQVDIDREGRKAIHAASQVNRLERLLRVPYFGRIDFLEDGEAREEKIYIGIANFMEEKTHINLVYDWRAPVSSMFYDNETGRAGYNCPAGLIEGDILLKRQYKIWLGKIEFMFDCSLKIDDEILQEILSKSADSRMRTIVTSIQREQNKVIRDDINKLLVVQGPAGSGKTSIALHRVAYLLYRYRELILADNIVIFSPNRIFNDYISDVLPELGEENMHRTTFMEYAERILGNRFKLEDMGRQMEYILSGEKYNGYGFRINNIKYKASIEFLKSLIEYAESIVETKSFEDIIHDDIMIESREELKEYYDGLKFIPMTKRLEKIRNRLISKLDPLIKERIEKFIVELNETGEYLDKAEIKGRATFMAREEFNPVKEKIYKVTRLDIVECYINLLESNIPGNENEFMMGDGSIGRNKSKEIDEIAIKSIKEGYVCFEDVAPLLLINALLNGVSGTSHIKHVIIDEVQDYTPVQFEVLKQLFGQCSLTMLGDLNQSINPYMNIKRYEIVKEIFGLTPNAILNLTKSYRSTRQISEFCNGILGQHDGADNVNREGKEPDVFCMENMETLYGKLIEDINEFKKKGNKSIAVICRTAEGSKRIYEHISPYVDIRLISVDDDEFYAEASIVPSYLSKGLEFDAVLVFCDRGDYSKEEERKLFYTCCTRALHNLNIYCHKEVPMFIKYPFGF